MTAGATGVGTVAGSTTGITGSTIGPNRGDCSDNVWRDIVGQTVTASDDTKTGSAGYADSGGSAYSVFSKGTTTAAAGTVSGLETPGITII